MSQGRVTDFFSTRKRNPASQPSKRRKVEITSTQVDISTLDRTNSNQFRNLTQENESPTETPSKGTAVFSPLQTRAGRKAKTVSVTKKATRTRKPKVDPKQKSIEASLGSIINSENKGIGEITEDVTSSWDEHDGADLVQQETPKKQTVDKVGNGRKRGRNAKTTIKDGQKSDEATPEKQKPPVTEKSTDTKARKKLQLIHKANSENREETQSEDDAKVEEEPKEETKTKKALTNVEKALEKVKAMEAKTNKAKTDKTKKMNAEDLKAKLSKVENLQDLKNRLAEMKDTRKKIQAPKLKKFDKIEVEVEAKQESDTKPKVPAYERFHHLATPAAPTLSLPYKYRLLAEQFRGMDQVISMLHNRNETCTFSKLKVAVQKLTKRNFEKTHVGKIKTVYPDAYELRQEKGLQNMQGFKQSGYQLTVEARLEDDNSNKNYRPTFKASHLLERRNVFHNSLIHTVKQHHKEFLSKLDRPLTIPDDKITRWHPKFPLDEVPDILESPLPQPPDVKVYQTAKDVLAGTSGKITPKIEDALRSTIKEEEKKAAELAPPTVPTTPVKPPSANMKGVPMSLLEKIRAKEAAKTAAVLTRNPKEEKRLSMMKRLPDIIRIIRSHFVTEKKPALPIESVIQRVIDSHKSGIAPGDVEPHINMCIELIPEWMSSVQIKKGKYLKIDRTIELQQLSDKINNIIKKQ